jgi:glucosamine-6-phosphate deaminase
MSASVLYEAKIEDLLVSIYRSNQDMGQAAAREAAGVIDTAIKRREISNIIIATGNSQLTFLAALRTWAGIDWSKVNIFHLDEYVGLDPQHPAGFRNYLHHNIIDYINPKAFYSLSGQAPDLVQECKNYEELLRAHPADLCALGIGENGHLAFNDPPHANFADPAWVKVVELAAASRLQQVGEGHFGSTEEVPTHAMSVTIPAMLAARHVLAIVPEARKANAVYRTLKGPISEDCPSSLLRRVAHAHLFLDMDSAAEVSSMIKDSKA